MPLSSFFLSYYASKKVSVNYLPSPRSPFPSFSRYIMLGSPISLYGQFPFNFQTLCSFETSIFLLGSFVFSLSLCHKARKRMEWQTYHFFVFYRFSARVSNLSGFFFPVLIVSITCLNSLVFVFFILHNLLSFFTSILSLSLSLVCTYSIDLLLCYFEVESQFLPNNYDA